MLELEIIVEKYRKGKRIICLNYVSIEGIGQREYCRSMENYRKLYVCVKMGREVRAFRGKKGTEFEVCDVTLVV